MTQWEVKGRQLVHCNCNFGCPCQFSALPSKGDCQAALTYEIDSGHYGDVRLDGLRTALLLKWPGAIHEGNGHMQIIVDPAADEAQRAALETIMTGGDTEEMATMWFVYSATSPNRHETIVAPISVEMDIAGRTARVRVEGVFETETRPVPNIVTGDPYRARINLPNGFEYTQAEVASGRTRIIGGAIPVEGLTDSHAHLTDLHLTGQGVVRDAAAAA